MAARLTLFALTLWLALVNFYSNFANANLTVRPTDAVVLVNRLTYFNCSTSARNTNAKFVLWYHYPVNSPTRNDVYDEGVIMFEYKDRFRIERDLTEGVFNLVAERPSLADAGRYECQDGVGQGDKAPAELTVLEWNPSCDSNVTSDGVIGPNDCGLEPDDIRLTCKVTSYRGNIPPTLEWKLSGDKSNSALVVCDNSTSCNRTLKGNLAFNSQSFVCQTTKARRQQYGCSIVSVKVKYALSSRVKLATERDVKCYINTSQSCSYKWYNAKGDEVSSEENLGNQNPGQYKCEAQCEMNQQNKPCAFTAMEVEVVSPDPVPGGLAALVLIPILICVILLVCLVYCLYSRKKTALSVHKPVRIEIPKENEMITGENEELMKKAPPALSIQKTVHVEIKNGKMEVLIPSKAIEMPMETVGGNEVLMKVPSEGAAHSRMESLDEFYSLPIITNQGMVEKLTINQYFIDRGTSGAIYGPFRLKDKKCALKQIMYSPDKLTEERKEEIMRVRDRCMELNHPHLVKVFDVWFPSPALYVLMEYAEGRSLDKILRPKDAPAPLQSFPPEIVQDWALQIADGIKYLHGKNIVHRNLKAAHVLVMESPDVLPNTLKIGSYTLAREHDHSTVMSLKGTMAWMAPEYIRGEPFSTLSDVWSYGVTVWEILTRDLPFNEMRKETDLVRAAINQTLKLKIPESCPGQLRTILADCWNYEVNERPSFTMICDRLIKIADYVEESCLQ